MIDTLKAIEIAGNMFVEREGRKMKEGDEITAVFNNCMLVIVLENGKFDIHFNDDKPVIIDADVDIYSNEGNEK